MTGDGFCVILIIVWGPLSIIRKTLIIGSDNNETNFHSYYHLEALTDNKEFCNVLYFCCAQTYCLVFGAVVSDKSVLSLIEEKGGFYVYT